MRPFEACPFCNGEFMFDWINDTRRCNNCGALFTWRIIREPSGVPIDLTLQLKKAEDRITDLKAENDELKERVAMLDVTAVYKSLGEMGYIEQVDRLNARIAELEKENAMLKQLSQPIEFWSDEKMQIYKSNESRSVKSGNEECEE